jgi:hypothetical protein
LRITGSFVSALKASTESFEGLEIGIIPRVLGVGAGFGDNRSVLVKEHGESGVVGRQ